MKLISYKDLSKNKVLKLISQIPQNFEGWQNYNSDGQSGLTYLLYEQKRFDNHDFYFLIDQDQLVACGGFYEFDNMMLISVRSYTAKIYRFTTIQLTTVIPIQILRSHLEFNKDNVYITVNEYNRKIFRAWNIRNSRKIKGLSNQKFSTIEPFLEFQENPIIIQYVPQYLAKLSINENFKNSEFWKNLLKE